MLIEGEQRMSATPEQVWAALNNPAYLQKATPGCKELRQVGPDRYEALLELGVGGLKGRFNGALVITDKEPPHAYTLHLEGRGGPGIVKANLHLALAPAGDGTAVHYRVEAQLGGTLASMAGRVLGGIARMLLAQFFARLDEACGGAAQEA